MNLLTFEGGAVEQFAPPMFETIEILDISASLIFLPNLVSFMHVLGPQNATFSFA